ncbi:MAG: PAC2 family protein [Nitriliruptoraceae bacterium]
MDIFRPASLLTPLTGDPVLLLAVDGWTDAGAGGSTAAAALHDAFGATPIGTFDGDALFDYRDRRPELEIDRGILGELTWPEMRVDLVVPPAGPTLVTITGAEPDLSWRRAAADIVDLCTALGIDRYVGLGSVPGPIPHTRPSPLICTGNDIAAIELLGRAHEQVVVPASFQVMVEKVLGDAGLSTIGMWVRVPHYIAGAYPEASKLLLEQLSAHLGTPVNTSPLDGEIEESRARLELAASGSSEVTDHVLQLERLYDAEHQARSNGDRAVSLSEEEVPSADELAAQIEQFLRGRTD